MNTLEVLWKIESKKLNCMVFILWQSSAILLPVYALMGDNLKTSIALFVFLVASIVLKFTWLDKVKKNKD
ncbi:hypothetical protein [Mariniflexile sp.]|uniref:hypothetical protein n=1 Tax=Mariniflexile sp. TaxID=1979402 RepID=UPI003561BF80